MITAKAFKAKDYAKAVSFKEQCGGVMRRIWLNNQIYYEVRFLPPIQEDGNGKE